MSIHGLHCCRIFNTHLLSEPVQAACRSVKPMAWAQRCHCCYLGQAAPHGEGDTKPLPWRDFGVPGFYHAQECLSRAAVQNYQVGFGRTLVGICCCASCMLLSRDSARLCCCAGRVSDIGSAKHCWLRPAVPTLQFSGQAQDATPLGANSLLTPLSQPSGRRAGQCAVQQADGPWCAGQTAACQ